MSYEPHEADRHRTVIRLMTDDGYDAVLRLVGAIEGEPQPVALRMAMRILLKFYG
jgi:hypothetical protein